MFIQIYISEWVAFPCSIQACVSGLIEGLNTHMKACCLLHGSCAWIIISGTGYSISLFVGCASPVGGHFVIHLLVQHSDWQVFSHDRFRATRGTGTQIWGKFEMSDDGWTRMMFFDSLDRLWSSAEGRNQKQNSCKRLLDVTKLCSRLTEDFSIDELTEIPIQAKGRPTSTPGQLPGFKRISKGQMEHSNPVPRGHGSKHVVVQFCRCVCVCVCVCVCCCCQLRCLDVL